MFRISTIICLVILSQYKVSAQVRPLAFEDLKVMQQKEARPVVVLIMTDWCKYCHSMKNTMLKNKKVSSLLSDKFYVIFLNAEQRSNIIYADRTFKFKPSGVNTGFHELAAHLGSLNGQVSYPSLCFLNEKNEIIYQYAGFLAPGSLSLLLQRVNALITN